MIAFYFLNKKGLAKRDLFYLRSFLFKYYLFQMLQPFIMLLNDKLLDFFKLYAFRLLNYIRFNINNRLEFR